MLKVLIISLLGATAHLAAARAQDAPLVSAGAPAPDCRARVNYDRNAEMPGFLGENGTCHPFMPVNQFAPPDQPSGDFYADEFTDAKIRERWEACKRDEACASAARTGARGFARVEDRDTGVADAFGRIDPEGEVALKAIRRPAYFGQAPFDEPIARAEERTYTVEFTAPRDNYERLQLGQEGDIKLRGWYLVGAGIDDGSGAVRRALVIMNNGGGNEITATDDPAPDGVVVDPATGNYDEGVYPNGVSEEPGMRHWRGFVHALNEAGFDVLVTDRRGNGISGGLNGWNTAEQANDMFRQLAQLRGGEGLRVLTPIGQTVSGIEAANAIFGEREVAELPVVLAGYSRGSYAVAWAMHKNVVENCDHGLPDAGCAPPVGDPSIKGAILYGPNAGGLGYRLAGHDMIEAALRTEFNTTYYVDSGVLANIDQWPALQVIRGTWDYVEGLEGSLDAYRRAAQPKDIFVFHGPHQLSTQAPENMARVGERMVAFAKAAVLDGDAVEGATAPADLKALVLSAPDHWELTSEPAQASSR